ncbi:MAG TPA: imidazolonepropionase [Solibacterales bacterium]|nr:imidazolonepropionase [Bryobacterales bacterium]
MKRILVRGARQLLTLHGPSGPRRGHALNDPGLIQNGALLIENGVIVAVGPSRRIENLAEARHAETIDADGRVVLPGFVDSHTHLVCGPPRLLDYEMRLQGKTYQEIAKKGGGILSSVRAVRSLPKRTLETAARKTIDGMVRHGTTTVEAKSGYGLDEAGETKTLKTLEELNGVPLDVAATYLGAHVVPPEFQGRPDHYIEWMCRAMIPAVARRGLAQFADVYCEPTAFSVEQARAYLRSAREHGLGLKLHAEQFARSGGVQLGVELDAVSVDHLEQAERADAEVLARSTTIATLLPGSVFHLGLQRYAPARLFIDSGAAVALASDYNPGTSPSYSMPMMLSLACTQMRMTPAEAIAAATINGAWALRMADRVGSLEFGKQADLIMADVADYREIPYQFGVNAIHLTMKKGAILYRRNKTTCPGN